MPEIVNLADILYMLIRQSKTQNFAWEPANRVRHSLIMLKSQVPNFCSKMLLGFYLGCFSKKISWIQKMINYSIKKIALFVK